VHIQQTFPRRYCKYAVTNNPDIVTGIKSNTIPDKRGSTPCGSQDGDEESWVATQGATLATEGKGGAVEENIPSMDDDDVPSIAKRQPSDEKANPVNDDDDDGIPDMADFETDDATMEVDEVINRRMVISTSPVTLVINTR
jgi:hypothetical protein